MIVHDTAGDTAPTGEPATHKHRGLRSLLPAPIWHVGRLLFLALIVEYLVVPQLAGPRKVAHLVTQVNPLLLLAGLGLEAGALACYAQLTRTVLPSGHTLSFFTVLRIQLTTLSVSHCAPGGSATGSALGYRLMTQARVAPSDVGFALATQGIGSAVVLNLIFWLALVVSIPVWGFSAVYLLAAGVGLALLAAGGSLIFVSTRGEQRVGATLERFAGRVPLVDGAAVRRSFEQVAGRLQDLGRQRDRLGRALLWGTGNWLLDAASLAVFVGAFGRWVNPDGLLVAYGLANVLAVIPLTPGGLGRDRGHPHLCARRIRHPPRGSHPWCRRLSPGQLLVADPTGWSRLPLDANQLRRPSPRKREPSRTRRSADGIGPRTGR